MENNNELLETRDTLLVESAKNGDQQAFEMLFAKYQAPIYRYLLLSTGNQEAAEDLTQETFMRVWHYRESLRNVENVKAWIYKIAHNIMINYYRKQSQTISLYNEETEEEILSIADTFSMEEYVETKEIIQKLISQLGKEHRSIILLYYVSNMPQSEIAKTLDVDERTVRRYIRRTMDQLRQAYEQIDTITLENESTQTNVAKTPENERNLPVDVDCHGRDEKRDRTEREDSSSKQLHAALLSAFPTRQDLEMMVFDQLHEHLSAVVRDDNLEHTVFELIQWSMAQGRLEELVSGAIKQSGQNPQLMHVAKQLTLRNDQNPTHDVATDKTTQKIPTYASVIPNQDTREKTLAEITQLNEPYRTVLLLHFIEQLSYQELVQRLNRPLNTIKSQVRRGIQKLQKMRNSTMQEKTEQAIDDNLWTKEYPLLPKQGELSPVW